MYKLRKFIGVFLIYTLITTRVFVLLPTVSADEISTAPVAPTAPSAPTAPTAPTAPSAPTAPIAPTTSTYTYTAPTTPSVSTVPYMPTSFVLPTGEAENTTNSLPTVPTAPTAPSAPVLNTTSLPSQDTGNQTGNSTSPDGFSSNNSSDSNESVNDPANTNTGPVSHNEAYEKLDKKLEVMNQNLAELQNKIYAVSNSGFNYANLNTLDGQVVSNDATASINLLNKLNSNMTGVGSFEVFNIYGTYSSDVVFQMADTNATESFSSASTNVSKNATTGSGSTNIADSSNTFTVKEANGNDATINNDINIQANTGGNSSSYNTGAGVVQTGNASAVGNVVNMSNTNLNVGQWLWGVVNIFGQLVGDIILPKDDNDINETNSPSLMVENSDTGPLSNNVANYQSTDTTSFQNSNMADISTDINITANSGNNVSNANTGGGLVVTGNTDVSLSDTTVANSNTVKEDGTVWMVVVNEAGKWVGYIIGLDEDSNYASNLTPASGTTVQNIQTGPLSDNYSSYSQTTNTIVENENDSSINNNINVTADTGNNTTTYNTGPGVIQTGDAKASVNVVNMSNMNVTAKKFIGVLVNVIGGWVGNVITPNQQSTDTDQVLSNIQTNVPAELPELPTLPEIPPIGSVPADNVNTITNVVIPNTTENLNFNYYESQQSVNYVNPVVYTQAAAQVSNQKVQVRQKSQILVNNNSLQKAEIEQKARVIKRGLFMSPAFAKATESSFPGSLFGGASLKVTNSWLAVLPLALFIFLTRRRKKYNLQKYFDMFLSIIL